MPWQAFETCRQRIDRAEAHLRAVAEFWGSLMKEEPYSAFVRVDDDGTGRIWVQPQYDRLPHAIALYIGEALYQLRAALDASVYGAAVMETGQDPPPDEEKLEFPICASPEDFEKASWKIRPLSEERRRIIEAVQPYRTPDIAPELMVFNVNRTLGILHDWARKDRHRKLHVVGSWGSDASPKVRFPEGVRLVSMTTYSAGFLEEQNEVAAFVLDGFVPGMKVEANPDMTIEIALDESPPPCAATDSLGNRLRAMVISTRLVTKAIEKSFDR
jgi:hypothetical protein